MHQPEPLVASSQHSKPTEWVRIRLRRWSSRLEGSPGHCRHDRCICIKICSRAFFTSRRNPMLSTVVFETRTVNEWICFNCVPSQKQTNLADWISVQWKESFKRQKLIKIVGKTGAFSAPTWCISYAGGMYSPTFIWLKVWPGMIWIHVTEVRHLTLYILTRNCSVWCMVMWRQCW